MGLLRVAYLEPRTDPTGPRAESTAAIVGALEGLVELTRFRAAAHGRGLEQMLWPKRFDRVLGVFENAGDLVHGLTVLRRYGGVAALHGWRLDQLAEAAHPSLARSGGVLGALAALRYGGTQDLRQWRAGERGGLVLNRGVVRWADAFLVETRELAQQIQDERNTPTAIQILPLVATTNTAADLALRWVEALEVLPTHRTGAKSLISTAIAGADAAREARRQEG